MTKIEALKQTIENVESGKYEYWWSDVNSCNCGVVARTIMNGELPNRWGDMETSYSSAIQCSQTGIPLPRVFDALYGAGFSNKEIMELEWLGNEVIAKKLGWELGDCHHEGIKCLPPDRVSDYKTKSNLLTYLRAWVEILEAEQQPAYPDITKSLAILPTEEVADKKLKIVKA